MLQFLPWSQELYSESLERYKSTKHFDILDIELGGFCNMGCIYCDTPKYNENIHYSIMDIVSLLDSGQIRWLFLCGLGEPTAQKNKESLRQLMQACKQNHVRCSMFTNIVELDDDIQSYIASGVLYPLFKLDSFDFATLKAVYGANNEITEKQIKNIHKMPSLVSVVDGMTNICASIVPTAYNKCELPRIVDWCFDHNIFPLIGELEVSGNGRKVYDKLKLEDAELIKLKTHIANREKYEYQVPICPSVLFGVHINHEGNVVVDKSTGLSCHWFWLEEPQVEVLCRFNGLSMQEMTNYVLSYRQTKMIKVTELLTQQKGVVFGGCGGDVITLLKQYINIFS